MRAERPAGSSTPLSSCNAVGSGRPLSGGGNGPQGAHPLAHWRIGELPHCRIGAPTHWCVCVVTYSPHGPPATHLRGLTHVRGRFDGCVRLDRLHLEGVEVPTRSCRGANSGPRAPPPLPLDAHRLSINPAREGSTYSSRSNVHAFGARGRRCCRSAATSRSSEHTSLSLGLIPVSHLSSCGAPDWRAQPRSVASVHAVLRTHLR